MIFSNLNRRLLRALLLLNFCGCSSEPRPADVGAALDAAVELDNKSALNTNQNPLTNRNLFRGCPAHTTQIHKTDGVPSQENGVSKYAYHFKAELITSAPCCYYSGPLDGSFFRHSNPDGSCPAGMALQGTQVPMGSKLTLQGRASMEKRESGWASAGMLFQSWDVSAATNNPGIVASSSPKSSGSGAPLGPKEVNSTSPATDERIIKKAHAASNRSDVVVVRVTLSTASTSVTVRYAAQRDGSLSILPPGTPNSFFLESADHTRVVPLVSVKGAAINPARTAFKRGEVKEIVLQFPPIDASWFPVDVHEGRIRSTGADDWNFDGISIELSSSFLLALPLLIKGVKLSKSRKQHAEAHGES